MKILVDENIPATTVTELLEQGMDDQQLWQKAVQEKRLLITTDKGFAEHRENRHYGLLIVRLKQPSRDKIHQRISQALRRYAANQWPSLMVVMRDSFQSSWKSHHKKG